MDLIYNNSSSKSLSKSKNKGEFFDKKRISNPVSHTNDPCFVYGGINLNMGPQVNSVKNININNLI